MDAYLSEPVDNLGFSADAKSRRYATERYRGAVGRNWYTCDPTLQFLMRFYLGREGAEWAAPHLERVGALMGGPIAERAEETDRNPPRLEKYDRWGHDTSRIVMPRTFEDSKRDLLSSSFGSPAFADEARRAGVDVRPLTTAWSYMLNQAEIGMTCALGTGDDMVVRMAERYAPEEVKARVRELFASGEMAGEAAQLFTERTGGSDLGAMETTATWDGAVWRLNGFKWFVSNANGSAYVVLAKPLGATDDTRGVAPFLVLRETADGRRNGIRVRRLKDKLGTKAVASAEVELVDAEAYLLAPGGPGAEGTEEERSAGDGRGLARMMELTNGARLGIALMGVGCARRALVESLCYATAREAFGAPLADHPLMQRKLAEMVVEVEAAQAIVFDGYLGGRLRLAPALVKLRAARLGITAASDAIEIHGGNGYIEQWPVARILRDAQVNTVWEGPDNILCLDVKRAVTKQQAHLELLDRLRAAAGRAPEGDDATACAVADHVERLERAVEAWARLDPPVAEARLYPLAQYMADVYSAAMLLEQAGFERSELHSDRKALLARLYVRAHLGDRGPLRGIDEPAEDLARFKELLDGAFAWDG
ncbi:MAG TPA: acyl-CoA dehydrogenase family protein [Acidimicrobiales bacterium]|nr:acyl-CoA dehydrogenase family protein [Acidimicrobiales bacterium]